MIRYDPNDPVGLHLRIDALEAAIVALSACVDPWETGDISEEDTAVINEVLTRK